MALKSKSEINEDFEVNEPQKKISFEDIECEAEFVDESEEQETKKFYTLSGKESWYEPTWERYTINDVEVGQEMEGRPELRIIENKDKTYDALCVRVMDDGEILDLYVVLNISIENIQFKHVETAIGTESTEGTILYRIKALETAANSGSS